MGKVTKVRRRLAVGPGLILFCIVLLPSIATAGDRIYGEELMTLQERDAYRQQLWERKTVQEREVYRERHRRSMQDRAKNLGIPLPDDGLTRLENLPEMPAPRRPDDGLRRLADEAPAAGVRRWEREPASAGALRRWPAGDAAENQRGVTSGAVAQDRRFERDGTARDRQIGPPGAVDTSRGSANLKKTGSERSLRYGTGNRARP